MSPLESTSVDPSELPSYPTLTKSLTGNGLLPRPFLARARSRSDTWSQFPSSFRHNADVHPSASTHCWKCGAALLSQRPPLPSLPPFHAKFPPLSSTSPSSPTLRPGVTSQLQPVEAQAPLVSASSRSDTPAKTNSTSSLSQTDKLMRMKDAMLDATDIPVIALWHDESTSVPNKAVARIMHFDTDPVSDDASDVLSRYRLFTEDYKRELELHEFPLVVLCRTQKPFSRLRVGILDSQSRQKVYEVIGKCVYDEKSGAFQAAVCALKDVTWYTDLLKVQNEQNERNEQQFQLICETLPQIVCNPSERLPRCLEECTKICE